MRRAMLLALTIALLLCSGCGGNDAAALEAWRQETMEKSVTFLAAITALSGTEETDYRARCAWEEGETRLELTEPALLRGVTVRCGEDGASLEFDGARLELGSLEREGVSPCAALPALYRALRLGRLMSVGREGEQLMAEYALSPAESACFWWERETMALRYAEIRENGRTVVFCTIEDWQTGE